MIDLSKFKNAKWVNAYISKIEQRCDALAVENAALREALEEYGEHGRKCILARWEAGKPTPEGRYQMKYGGTWYDSEHLPECQCGLSAALRLTAGEPETHA